MAQGNSVVHLYAAQIGSLNIHLPEKEEQKKIAAFIGIVDEKIVHLQKKKDLLENYKKGCMQKLFSQEIRFTDNNGNAFSDWKEKKLKSIASINPSTETLPSEFVYIDLESVQKGCLLFENIITAMDAPSRAQRVLKKNDVLFQTVRPYQKNNYFFDHKGDYVASTGYAQLRAKDGYSPMFVYQLLHTDTVLREVMAWSTGTNYPAINSSDLAIINVICPCMEEQQKIADFLSAIDDKIALVSEELYKAKTFKKGLLQQMFV